MAAAATDFQFSGLAKCLIRDQVLTETDAQIYIQDAQKKKVPFISYLVSNKLVDSQTIAAKASVEFGVPFLDLDAIDFRNLPVNLINEK